MESIISKQRGHDWYTIAPHRSCFLFHRKENGSSSFLRSFFYFIFKEAPSNETTQTHLETNTGGYATWTYNKQGKMVKEVETSKSGDSVDRYITKWTYDKKGKTARRIVLDCLNATLIKAVWDSIIKQKGIRSGCRQR